MFHPFQQYHFVDLGQRIKSLNVVTQCEANYLLVKGTSASQVEDCVRFLRQAEVLFRDLLSSSPNHVASLRQYGMCLYYLALNQERLNEEKAKGMGLILTPDLLGNTKMRASLKLFDRAVELDPYDKGLRLSYAKALMAVGDDVRAEEHLLCCVELDPCYVPGLRDYAEFLDQSGRGVRKKKKVEERKLLIKNVCTSIGSCGRVSKSCSKRLELQFAKCI